ncbi:MAG TPA: hypothetical protein VMW75_16160 [Thermoanaerobaculia bacterium]|nr:hypothetical protein [Thermoanaerobaculia bacterium]
MKIKASHRNLQLKIHRETLHALDQPELRAVAGGLTLTCFQSCGGAHTCWCTTSKYC